MDVKTVCLGVLTLEDATGYEIQKRVKCGCFQLFFDASYSSIYPSLAKLTEDGMVTCEARAQDGKPDKKVYSITAKGRLEFVESLGRPPAPDKYRSDFMARMLFCDLLLPAELSGLIDQRLEGHQTMTDELGGLLDRELTEGEKFIVRYARAINEAASQFIDENRHLIEVGSLLAQVREAK